MRCLRRYRIGLGFALFVACNEVSGPPGEPVDLARVSGDGQRAEVGRQLPIPLSVRVRDARGAGVEGIRVDFTVESGGGSVSERSAISDAAGVARTRWTLGTDAATEQRVVVRADLEAGMVSLAFRATAVAGAATALAIVQGDGQHRAAGASLRDTLVVRVADRYGNPISGASVQWRIVSGAGTLAPNASNTAADGTARTAWTLGAETGTQQVEAAVANLQTPFTATADPRPVVVAITPDTAAPGAPLTIQGDYFNEDPLDTHVIVNGTAAELLSATRTEIVVAVPCTPTSLVNITLDTNGATTELTHPLRHDNPIRLDVGKATQLSGAQLWCNEIAGSGGRYVLAIANPATSQPPVSFRVRGAAGQALSPGRVLSRKAAAEPPTQRAIPKQPAFRSVTGRLPGVQLASFPRVRRTTSHGRRLDAELTLLRSLSGRALPFAAATEATTSDVPAVQDTLMFRIPDVASVNLCTVRTTVSARVVYVGTRAIVLEDIRAPLATRMDSLYRAVGEQFDSLYYPLLVQNFGDPLAYDAETDADGHVYLVFTRAVNDLGGVAGFVTAGNFFPASLCAASNRAEVFFGIVPTVENGGPTTPGTRDYWYRTMRPVVVHESKHIASYAEHLARSAVSFEEAWLEEATAMIAEELYARTQFGYAQGGDVQYQASLFCEARPTNASCRDKPFVMYDHFTLLGDYLGAVETRTPLAPVSPTDVSFYGSGWALLRWILDHTDAEEDETLRALTTETNLSGAANLQARSGFALPDVLADWILAIALDGRPGFAPENVLHTLPSWNVRDIFTHMNSDFPNLFPLPFPLVPRTVSFGDFLLTISSLRAGTATVIELSGNQGAPQLIEIAGEPEGALASIGLRARLLRIN